MPSINPVPKSAITRKMFIPIDDAEIKSFNALAINRGFDVIEKGFFTLSKVK